MRPLSAAVVAGVVATSAKLSFVIEMSSTYQPSGAYSNQFKAPAKNRNRTLIDFPL